MKRIKLLLYMLFHIGPKSFLNTLIKSIYEHKIVYHYKLPLEKLKPAPNSKVSIESKIYLTFSSLDDTIKEKIRNYFGIEKLRVFKERLDFSSDIVISFINGKFASYCFFAFSQEQFQFFRLPEKEIYFYDCYTFPEFRGVNAIYWETRTVIETLRKRGYKEANVEIEKNNISSIRAFAKVGFYKVYEIHLKRILFFERVVIK